MSRNGSGSYSLPNNTAYPGVNGVTVTTADWNTLLADIAAALTGSVAADGQTPMTGNLPMGGNRITGGAAAVTVTDFTILSDVTGLIAAVAPSRSAISGLVPSTAGSSSTISVSAGAAADSTNASTLTLAASISKTTSAWAVGTAAGGLDTGAIANSTGYYLWLIKRVDTGVVDVLISLSSTAPTMPASYTLKRLIGWGKTNGSAQWTSFTAYETAGGGLRHIWATPTLEANLSVGTSRSSSTPSGVPTGFSVEASLSVAAVSASGITAIHIFNGDEADAAVTSTTTGYDISTSAASVTAATTRVAQTSSAGLFHMRANVAATTVQATCNGFTWSRR